MKEQKKKRHIEGMDALRGFAILGVVLYHVMPGRFPGGFLGVNMFLVLSGYLIYKTSVWDLEHGVYEDLSASAHYDYCSVGHSGGQYAGGGKGQGR